VQLLHLYTSIPQYLYTSIPLYLSYISIPLHIYTSAPVHLFTCSCLHLHLQLHLLLLYTTYAPPHLHLHNHKSPAQSSLLNISTFSAHQNLHICTCPPLHLLRTSEPPYPHLVWLVLQLLHNGGFVSIMVGEHLVSGSYWMSMVGMVHSKHNEKVWSMMDGSGWWVSIFVSFLLYLLYTTAPLLHLCALLHI
jgi:hypothetical protein